jgi:glycosyltransferase involved in cell wall biosynthesis
MPEQDDGAAAAPAPAGRLLTVGIPVFNGRSLLRSCLHSVISSGLPRDRFEIVVADDGSREPETLAILAEFSARLADEPGFFRVLSLGVNSGGAARPRNAVLDAATGAYVFFVDGDDTIGSLALERIAAAVTEVEPDWVALHQVPVNGRAAGCTVRQTRVEVSRDRALSTLTVHKVFRRAEIERHRAMAPASRPAARCSRPSASARRRSSGCGESARWWSICRWCR